MAPKLKNALITECVQLKYSPDWLTCSAAAKTPPEFELCDKKLTPEQQKASEQSNAEIMKPLMDWLQAEAAKQGVKLDEPAAGSN